MANEVKSLQDVVDLVLAKEYEKTLEILDGYFAKAATGSGNDPHPHPLNPEIPASLAHSKIEEELTFLVEFIYRRTKYDDLPEIHPIKQLSRDHLKGLIKTECNKKFYALLRKMDRDIVEERKAILEQPGGSREFKLRDGRTMGYRMYGKPATPEEDVKHVFFFHGTPGSRFFFLPSWEHVAIRLNAKFHVIERPGFGISEVHPHRSVDSFLDDVVEYADAKDIKQFYVMGYSAGTPYAAAAATVIPHERVLGISVVAGISNAPDATRKMTWENAFAWKMLLRYRRLLHFMVKPSKSNLKKPASGYFDNEELGPIDELLLVKYPQIIRLFGQSKMEQFTDRTAGTRGEVEDYMLFKSRWESLLEPADRRPVPRVHLTCGASDRGSTPEMSKFLNLLIPGSTLKVVENAGHLVLFTHFDEIASELLR